MFREQGIKQVALKEQRYSSVINAKKRPGDYLYSLAGLSVLCHSLSIPSKSISILEIYFSNDCHMEVKSVQARIAVNLQMADPH